MAFNINYPMIRSAVFVVLVGMFCSACQTSMVKQWESIKPGMEKNDVLALMGSPNQTQRFHGKDRWFYNFYDSQIRFQKEVQFFEGNAVYIGEVWQPAADQSAAIQDSQNLEKEKQLEIKISKDVETHRTNYEAYEAQTKGEDKVRYLPTFEPIH